MAGGSYVGLDIGSSQIKVAEVRKTGAGVEVTALGVAPTPPEAYQNNTIVDPQLLAQAVKNLLKQSGISTNRVVSSISGTSSVVVRVIDVPSMNPAELAETMKWEVERHVPFAASEVIMDYQAIERPEGYADGQNMEVLLAVAQQDFVDRHVEMLMGAGLKPQAIDVEPLAVGRTLLELKPKGAYPAGHTVAVVNIGAANTDVGIFRDRLLVFPRTLPMGGDTLTRAIQDFFQVDAATAEAYKREHGEIVFDATPQAATNDPFGGGGGFGGFIDFGGQDFGAAPAQPAPEPPPTSSPSGRMPFDFSGGEAAPPASPAPFGGSESGMLGGSGETGMFGATPADPNAMFGGTPPAAEAPPASSPFDFSQAQSEQADFAGTTTAPQPMFDPNAPVADPNAMFGGTPQPSGLPVPVGAPAANDPARDALRAQIFGAIAPVLVEMAQEIRRSLDYYRGRAADALIHEVILIGGTAKLRSIAQFLETELGVPTHVGDPLQSVTLSSKNFSPDYLQDIAPLFPVSIGLGVRDLIAGPVVKKPKPPKAKKAPKNAPAP